LNLQSNSADPYDACPYCLTEITQGEESIELPAESPEVEAEHEVADEVVTKETVGVPQQSSSCGFHLGYLSERSKGQIPDECMTCKDIVECMLKKMRE
jgi:hypothetical protein